MKTLLTILMAIPLASASRASTKIDRDGIRSVFKKHSAHFQQCYQEALKEDDTLSGKVMLDFDINPDGSVGRSGVNEGRSTLHSEILEACLLATLKSKIFPANDKDTIFQIFYPIVFNNK